MPSTAGIPPPSPVRKGVRPMASPPSPPLASAKTPSPRHGPTIWSGEGRVLPAMLPKRNPLLGTFVHAPMSSTGRSRYMGAAFTTESVYLQRRSLRQNPHVGTKHSKKIYSPAATERSREQAGQVRFTEITRKLGAAESFVLPRRRASSTESERLRTLDAKSAEAASAAAATAAAHKKGGAQAARVAAFGWSKSPVAMAPAPVPSTAIGSLGWSSSSASTPVAATGGLGITRSSSPGATKMLAVKQKDEEGSGTDEEEVFIPIGVGTPGEDIRKVYKLGTKLGAGEFATVYAARPRADSPKKRGSRELSRVDPATIQKLAGDIPKSASVSRTTLPGKSAPLVSPVTAGAGSNDQGNPEAIKPAEDTVVVKAIKKRYLFSEAEKQSAVREVRIHSRLHHANIVELLDTFESKDHVYLVMERVEGNDLGKYLMVHRRIAEPAARLLFRGIVHAVDYVHRSGYVHCDIKPQNIVLKSERAGEGTSLGVGFVPKLCDFGCARRARDARYFKKTGSVSLVPFGDFTGTVGYVAPEILKHEHYSTPVDMWSLGVMLYSALGGLPPFTPYHSCLTEELKFPAPFFNKVSDEAKALLRRLLVVDPSTRLTASEMLANRWVNP